MSGWNYRVLAHDHKGEVYFQIHDVYYNKKNKPDSYTRNPSWVGSETIEGMQWTLDAMKEAFSKPILWAGHKFPLEYKQYLYIRCRGVLFTLYESNSRGSLHPARIILKPRAMEDKTEQFILCACSSFDHQAMFWVWPEESLAGCEIYVNFHLAKRNGFFKRLWYGLKYAFGFKSRYGAWDEFIFGKREFEKLKDFINSNNL